MVNIVSGLPPYSGALSSFRAGTINTALQVNETYSNKTLSGDSLFFSGHKPKSPLRKRIDAYLEKGPEALADDEVLIDGILYPGQVADHLQTEKTESNLGIIRRAALYFIPPFHVATRTQAQSMAAQHQTLEKKRAKAEATSRSRKIYWATMSPEKRAETLNRKSEEQADYWNNISPETRAVQSSNKTIAQQSRRAGERLSAEGYDLDAFVDTMENYLEKLKLTLMHREKSPDADTERGSSYEFNPDPIVSAVLNDMGISNNTSHADKEDFELVTKAIARQKGFIIPTPLPKISKPKRKSKIEVALQRIEQEGFDQKQFVKSLNRYLIDLKKDLMDQESDPDPDIARWSTFSLSPRSTLISMGLDTRVFQIQILQDFEYVVKKYASKKGFKIARPGNPFAVRS